MNVLEASRAATKQEDLTQATAGGGGFVRELPKAGKSLFRLQSYIEMGKKQPKNATHKPSVDCILTFELLHPKHMITPEDTTKAPFPMTYTMHIPKAGTATSRYRKLFAAMNYEGTHTHFDTMIGGTPFLGELFHVDSKELDAAGKPKATYVNLNDAQGTWKIGAPRIVDPMTEAVTVVPVPEMYQEGKLFLWEEAGWSDELISAAWNTLFIDGNRDDGRSKNWIQDGIMQAVDWNESRTRTIVEGGTIELPAELLGDIDAIAADQEAPKAAALPEGDDDAAALAALGLN